MKIPSEKFLFDGMLGRLCRKMRLLGYDSRLNPPTETGRFLINAEKDGRIAVTLAKRRAEMPGPKPIILEKAGTREQIVELFTKTGIKPHFAPFTRCLECNEPLKKEDAETARTEVPPFVAENFVEFFRCPTCRRIYWKGTHYEAMKRYIERIETDIGSS